MRNARRMMTWIASVAVLSTGAVILTSHAADHSPPLAPAASAPAAAPGHTGAVTGATPPKPATAGVLAGATPPKPAAAGASPPKPVTPGAPQVPEESATIRDDPTIAPDSKQSADNSVSFPNDI